MVEVEQSIYGPTGFNRYYFRQMMDLYPDFLLAYEAENGEMAGYALGAIGQQQNQGWVLSLAVKPDYQGQGIARQLSHALIKALNKAKCKSIWLTVSEDNDSAVGLYKKLGFVYDHIETDYYGPDADRMVMKLSC